MVVKEPVSREIIRRDVVLRAFHRIFPDAECFGVDWRGFNEGFRGIGKKPNGRRGMDDVQYEVWYKIGERNRREYDGENRE